MQPSQGRLKGQMLAERPALVETDYFTGLSHMDVWLFISFTDKG